MRIIDRLRAEGALDEKRLVAVRESLYAIIGTLDIVEMSRSILSRASQPSPTVLGTLDAIHLASALAWRERTGRSLVMATHDEALATGARAQGLRTVGLLSGA